MAKASQTSNIPGPGPGENAKTTTAGQNTTTGIAGNDTVTSSAQGDTITGSSGSDTVTGSSQGDTVNGEPARTDPDAGSTAPTALGAAGPKNGTSDGAKTFDRDGTERGAGYAPFGGVHQGNTRENLDARTDPAPDPATMKARRDGLVHTTPQRHTLPDQERAVSIPSGSEPQHFDPSSGRVIVG